MAAARSDRRRERRHSPPTHRALKSASPACGSLASLNILKRLGGNENRFGSPLLELAPDGIMKTTSYIRLFALLIFGNVFPSEFKGQIV